MRLYGVTLFVLATCLSVSAGNDVDARYVSYHELVGYIEKGEVQTIFLGVDPKIHGILLHKNQEVPFRSYRSRAPANDPFLLKMLESKKVEIKTAEHDEKSVVQAMSLVGFLALSLPIVNLVLLILALKGLSSLKKTKNKKGVL